MSPVLERIKASILHRLIMPNRMLPKKLYSNRQLKFAPGVTMNLYNKGDVISDYIAFLGYYERELSDIVTTIARSGLVMVDAGANMGYFSLLFAANSIEGKVFSFEPNPKISAILQQNIQRNVCGSRISCIEKALSDKNGILRFNYGNDVQSGWGHVDDNAVNQVSAISLNEFFAGNPGIIIDLLKIDVEGHELSVLRGASDFISRRQIKNIFFEINPEMLSKNNTNQEEIESWLGKYGYQTKVLKNELVHAFL